MINGISRKQLLVKSNPFLEEIFSKKCVNDYDIDNMQIHRLIKQDWLNQKHGIRNTDPIARQSIFVITDNVINEIELGKKTTIEIYEQLISDGTAPDFIVNLQFKNLGHSWYGYDLTIFDMNEVRNRDSSGYLIGEKNAV